MELGFSVCHSQKQLPPHLFFSPKSKHATFPQKLSIVCESNICAGFLRRWALWIFPKTSSQAAPRNNSVTTVTTCCSYLFLWWRGWSFPTQGATLSSKSCLFPGTKSGESRFASLAHHTGLESVCHKQCSWKVWKVGSPGLRDSTKVRCEWWELIWCEKSGS